MIYGYLRVSSDKQTVESQKTGIVQYCNEHGIKINKWIAESVSGAVDVRRRRLGGIVPNMKKGDTLIVSEISRLGRSTSMVITLIERLLARDIKIVSIKQGITLGEKGGMSDIMTKMIVNTFAWVSEFERDIIRSRVTEGIRRKISEGFDWGSRVRGMKYNTKLVRRRRDMIRLAKNGAGAGAIARTLGCSKNSVYNHVRDLIVNRQKECSVSSV